jgi:hypothetical protein
MGASTNGDDERRAYLQLMWLTAVVGGDVECIGNGTPGTRATGDGGSPVCCSGERRGGDEQLVG